MRVLLHRARSKVRAQLERCKELVEVVTDYIEGTMPPEPETQRRLLEAFRDWKSR